MNPLFARLMLAGALLVGACDRRPAVPATAPSEPPKVSTTQSAGQPAATRPVNCLLSFDGHGVIFPPAKATISKDESEWTLTLFTDDSADTGNKMYLSMQLTAPDDGNLNEARWVYFNAESAVEDSPEGLFVDGRQFRPLNVKAEFADHGDIVVVKLSGEFQAVDDSPADKNLRRTVTGRIDAVRDRK